MTESYSSISQALVPENDLLTLLEAGRLLRVSTVTLHRWIRQGRLPAYRVGPRKVRVRRVDLTQLVTLKGGEVSAMKERRGPIASALNVQPLSSEEQGRQLQALREAEVLTGEMKASRGGKPLSSSAPLIRRARKQRSAQI